MVLSLHGRAKLSMGPASCFVLAYSVIHLALENRRSERRLSTLGFTTRPMAPLPHQVSRLCPGVGRGHKRTNLQRLLFTSHLLYLIRRQRVPGRNGMEWTGNPPS